MLRRADSVDFIFPLDGVMLTDTAGQKTDEGLIIKISVDAPSGRHYCINGKPMTESMHELYTCDYTLKDYKTTLVLTSDAEEKAREIDVYYLRKAYYRYRFSLDDNIRFLRDLDANKGVYRSMFENPYLKLLKTMHDKHGTKYHINVYWETPDDGGFCIKDMTDKFKSEFIANSDWIRMSFHANAHLPQRPYGHATYEQVYREAARINEQIVRFAGEETFSKTVVTVHWGDISVEGAKALRDLGYKAFVSSYKWNTANGVDIRSYCDDRQVNILQKYGFWYDRELDIYHFRYNGGIQNVQPENFPALFAKQEKDAPLYRFKDICLHEQQFYPDFPKYQPNYYEKMDAATSWCDEHGYKPILMDELFEFNTHKN